jgi:hypothetical protein
MTSAASSALRMGTFPHTLVVFVSNNHCLSLGREVWPSGLNESTLSMALTHQRSWDGEGQPLDHSCLLIRSASRWT